MLVLVCWLNHDQVSVNVSLTVWIPSKWSFLYFPKKHYSTSGACVKQKWRQRGRVVRAVDLKSAGPGFKSRSDHFLDLFSVVPSSTPR